MRRRHIEMRLLICMFAHAPVNLKIKFNHTKHMNKNHKKINLNSAIYTL